MDHFFPVHCYVILITYKTIYRNEVTKITGNELLHLEELVTHQYSTHKTDVYFHKLVVMLQFFFL